MNIGGEEWVEMPAPTTATSGSATDSVEGSPGKPGKPVARPSPGPPVKGKNESAEILNRSPRRVKKEAGGLRDVREIIRKELEIQD